MSPTPDPTNDPAPDQIADAVDKQSDFPPPPDSGVPSCSKDETHWVEVRMVDSVSKPVPGLKCRLRASDDSIRNGVLDSKGRYRFDGLPAGAAYVCFPELDEEVWTRA